MSEERDIQKDVNRSLGWIGIASASVAVLDLVAQIVILALWISPGQYGIATMAITLFPVLDMATDMGLSAAVIQRDDHTEVKISTVFWLNVFMSSAMFVVLALFAGPALGRLQGHEVVGLMLTAYGAKLIWQNVYLIPRALMRRELRFKELSVIRVIANFAEFSAKIALAAAGFGVWCFVLGPLLREFVRGVGIQIRHPWRPRFVLQIREAMDWMVFGFKTSFSQILFHLYSNVDYQVVGYFFGPVANGIYRLAYEIVLEPARLISEIIVQVAFPTFARLKYKRDLLIEQFISFTRMNLVIMLGFLGLVFVNPEDLILTFWRRTEWLPAADAARILCAVGVLRALSYVVPPLLDGIGRPSLTLWYMIVASVVLPTSFVLGALYIGEPTIGRALLENPSHWDSLSVAIAWSIGYPVAFLVLFAIALSLLDLRVSVYLRRIMGIPGCAALSMAGGFAARYVVQGIPSPGLRFAITSAVVVGIMLVSLAYLEGISPRSVMRAIKGGDADADVATDDDAAAAGGEPT